MDKKLSAAPPDQGALRELFGSCPTAVSVVTTLNQRGEPRGFTCNALCSLSLNPPLLLVCVDQQSNTLGPLLAHGAFVVNILADGAQDVSRVFASKSADKFAGVEWVPALHAKGSPLLSAAALAHAECAVVRVLPAGDHCIFIGRVNGVTVHSRRPLLYYQGSYAAWDSAVVLASGAR